MSNSPQLDDRNDANHTSFPEAFESHLPGRMAACEAGYRCRLPHWRASGAVYFVTWRLAAALRELAPAERDIVASALRHFDGDRYRLLAWVVMHDHVHVVVQPRNGLPLETITHSWKSFTARALQRSHGRRGTVWQDESFDRIVRNESELTAQVAYVRDNPFKTWPELREYAWVDVNRALCQLAALQDAAGRDARPTD